MAKGRFKIPLECPSCGRAGTTIAEEEEGWAYLKDNTATVIIDLAEGFKIVRQKSKMASVDLFCVDCEVSAIK